MVKKPTDEELEQRVKVLEKEAAERTQVEEELRESEEKLRSIMGSVNDVIFQLSPKGFIKYVSPKVEDIYGYKPKELIGKHLKKTTPMNEVPKALKVLKRLLSGKIIKNFEINQFDSRGTTFPMEISATPVKKGGKVIAVQGVMRDISERKRAEEALRKAHEDLGRRVEQRTAELAKANKELQAEIIERKWAEEGLADQNKYNKLRAEIWKTASDKSLAETDLIQRLLNEVGPSIDISRTAFLRLDSEKKEYVTELQWYKPEFGSTVGVAVSYDVAKHFFGREYVEIPKDLMPVVKQYAWAKLKMHGIKSYLVVLYGDKNNPQGLFTFSECEKEREWSELEKNILLEVVNIVSTRTDQIKAEEELRESEEKYRDIFENGSDLLYFHNLEGNFTEVNIAWRREYGYGEEDLANLTVRDLIPERYKYQFEDYLKRVKENGKDRGLMKVMTKDGRERIFEYRNSLVYDSTGPIGVRGSARDLTERIQAENAVKESEEKYRTVLESIEDGYYEVDIDGNLTFFNDSLCKMTGYTKDELMGMNNRQYTDKETAKRLYQLFNKVYTTGKPIKGFEYEIMVDRYGTKKHVESSVSLIRDRKGQPIGFRGIIRDIDERKLAEEEKGKLEAQLLRAEKMEVLGTLAGGVAHDLNNVLGGLVSYPELLLMEIPEESPLRRPILTIQKSGEKAAAIVQDLLTLARRGVAATEVVDLNHIISEYVKSPEHEKLKSYHPKVEVETDLGADLLNILGSPVHLSKTVMNLVSNAAEAMPGGGKITISTENRYIDRPIKGYDDVAEGDYITIRVSDNGVGISPEDMERIFEPFYTKKMMGRSGTGLGMAVVWGTVKDHKGYIDVKSAEGKGTTFILYFPVTRKELTKDKLLLSVEDYRGKGESVLVVDDVEEQREIASKMLKKLGYSITCVSSGEEAVDYMKKNSADLLILDMIMEPGIDGYETYRRILEFHPKQKAIIVSGFSETERVKDTQRLGAGAYVKKPYLSEKIGLAIRGELDK